MRVRTAAYAILRGVAGFAVSQAITAAGDKAGVSLRHGRHSSPTFTTLTRKHPVLVATAFVVAAPIVEEFVWRQLPTRVLAERGKPINHLAGLAMAAGFAATHAGPKGIPVPQFVSGLNYWQLCRQHGYWAAVLAHSTRNLLGGVLAYRQSRTK